MTGSLIEPFRRALDFRGRSRRRDYWLFVLWQVPVLLAGLAFGFSIVPDEDRTETLIGAPLVHVLVFGLPTLALQVRRMHDQDKTGWWVAVSALPYIGVGWLIFLMLQPGTWGPNRFGPDPRHGGWSGDLFD